MTPPLPPERRMPASVFLRCNAVRHHHYAMDHGSIALISRTLTDTKVFWAARDVMVID